MKVYTFEDFLQRRRDASFSCRLPVVDNLLYDIAQRLIAVEEGRQVVLDELSRSITALARFVFQM